MRKFLLALLLFFITILVVPVIYAQESITVTPQIQRIDLAMQASEAVISYKNGTSQTIELTFRIQDFRDLSENGVPTFLEPKEAETYKYRLSSWAQVSTNNLVLKSGEEKSVKVYIDKTRLAEGGHYSSLLAEIRNPDDKGKEVKVRSILASLIFVRTGSEFNREEGKIVSFSPDNPYLKFPERFNLRFQNSGNIDVTPHGLVSVHDILGKQVAKGPLNEDSLISLPETIRRYIVPVRSEFALLMPGIYTAKVTVRFGESERILTQEIKFVTMGSQPLITTLMLLLIPASILVLFRKLKRRKQKTHDSVK